MRSGRVGGLLHLGMLALAFVAQSATASDGVDVDRLMHDFGLSPDAAARVRGGDIVVSDPVPSSPRELAVGLAFLVPQSVAAVFAAFRSAVDMRADAHLRAVAVLHGSPDDFASVVLPAEETSRYLGARRGDALNLSSEEIEAFQAATDGGDARPIRLLRGMLSARYQAYRASGLDGIAPYVRAGGVVRKPADELLAACDAESLLDRYAPALWQLLHSYPRGKPAGLEESFYVLTYDLDGRPCYTLRHRMAARVGEGIVVVDRDFYVSHGYNTSLAISGLLPVSEGTMVFYHNRVSTDQLTGLGSSLKQAIGRGVMAKQLTAIFERSRACFAQETMCPAPVDHAVVD